MVEHEGGCITPESCPKDETPTSDADGECSNGMIFNECGSACPPTCDNPAPTCIFQCVEGKALYVARDLELGCFVS